MATVFMDQKGVILVNYLPWYRNTKNSECLPAPCSPHQENATNPLNVKLNPICHMLTLLGAHHILLISRIRVKCCFPMTLPGHTQVHPTETTTKYLDDRCCHLRPTVLTSHHQTFVCLILWNTPLERWQDAKECCVCQWWWCKDSNY